MIVLAARDYRALLDVAADLQAVERLVDFPDVLLPGLLRLIDADLAGWNDVDLRAGTVVGHVYPDQRCAAAFAGLSELPGDPPLVAHFRERPGTAAATISDICDRRAWHATAAYQEVYRHFSVETQLGLAMAATPTHMSGIVFNRDARDFSDRDRDVLSALCVQVEAAHRRLLHAASREAAVAALGRDAGWITVDGAGNVVDIGETAGALIAALGLPIEPGRPLPALPDELSTRRIDVDQLRTTLLAIRAAADPAALGLTRRQYDALRAVAGGATAREAARRLGISEKTLTTHLRDAYAALGVTSRVAALNLLRQRTALDDLPA